MMGMMGTMLLNNDVWWDKKKVGKNRTINKTQ